MEYLKCFRHCYWMELGHPRYSWDFPLKSLVFQIVFHCVKGMWPFKMPFLYGPQQYGPLAEILWKNLHVFLGFSLEIIGIPSFICIMHLYGPWLNFLFKALHVSQCSYLYGHKAAHLCSCITYKSSFQTCTWYYYIGSQYIHVTGGVTVDWQPLATRCLVDK